MKSNTYKEYIAPVVVLVSICLAMSIALAVVYGVTKPIIDTNSKAAADKARAELLKEADSFVQYDGKLVESSPGKVFVTEAFTAKNKAGMVVTVSTKSFGGPLTMMVGLDTKGSVKGVKVTDHADTPGLGTKDFDPGYLKQYKGLDKLNSTNVKDDGTIKYISGASVSGSAVHYGVYCAMEQFKEMGGVQ